MWQYSRPVQSFTYSLHIGCHLRRPLFLSHFFTWGNWNTHVRFKPCRGIRRVASFVIWFLLAACCICCFRSSKDDGHIWADGKCEEQTTGFPFQSFFCPINVESMRQAMVSLQDNLIILAEDESQRQEVKCGQWGEIKGTKSSQNHLHTKCAAALRRHD